MFSRFLQWVIHTWLRVSGKRMDTVSVPWLAGPYGTGKQIGDQFYSEFATRMGLHIHQDNEGGLLRDFHAVLNPEDKNLLKLNPRVAEFYEHTARFKLEVWSEWY